MEVKINNKTGELMLIFTSSEEAARMLSCASYGALGYQASGYDIISPEAARANKDTYDETALHILGECNF